MNKMLTLVSCVVLAGCATMSSIDKNYAMLDSSDGVDLKEAVAIAQKYCLAQTECKGGVRISTPEVVDLADEWAVEFWSKNVFALDHAYVVLVDKSDGAINEAKFAR